jgi:hypothetical protein
VESAVSCCVYEKSPVPSSSISLGRHQDVLLFPHGEAEVGLGISGPQARAIHGASLLLYSGETALSPGVPGSPVDLPTLAACHGPLLSTHLRNLGHSPQP